jgi:hypothetical protein
MPHTVPEPDFADLPRRVDRRRGAELVTQFFFPISPRTLERWPLTGRVVNGRLVFSTADLFAIARQRIDAAPAIKGGPAARTAA